MSKTAKNDIPDVARIREAICDVLKSGRSRSFANIGPDVARVLGLSREQRAYRIGKSKATLFENRLVQARAELVKEGVISYKSGKVKLEAKEPSQGERVSSSVDEQACKDAPTKSPKAPEGRPTKCLSFQEPYASYIATGVKDAEFRSKKVNVPIRNLVVCASKTPRYYLDKIPGLAYGFAIGMVDVVDCIGYEGDHVWKLENPRLIKPFEVHATAGFFYVADIPEVIPNDEASYRKYVLPYCHRGDQSDEDAFISSLISKKPDEIQKLVEVDRDKFDRVKADYIRIMRGRSKRVFH